VCESVDNYQPHHTLTQAQVKVLLSVQPQAPKRKVRFIIQRPSEDGEEAKRGRGVGQQGANRKQGGNRKNTGNKDEIEVG